jgi:hypothetical protein
MLRDRTVSAQNDTFFRYKTRSPKIHAEGILKTQTPSRTPAKSKNLKYWRERGTEDAWYQRSVQTTWWSVLGGIAIGVLVTQISPVLAALKTAQWYPGLYFLATIMIVAYSWVQTSWGSLVMKWPISIVSSLVQMVTNMSLAFAALNIADPPLWMAAMAVGAFGSFCIQINFFLSGAWDLFPEEKLRGYKRSLFAYGGLAAFILGVAIHLYLAPTQKNFMLYGIVSFVLSIGLMVWQHVAMQAEKREMGIP